MTEPIIINGVDVSGCESLIKGKQDIYCGTANSTKYNKCSHISNCCYKQLKSKEQECEKYKKCINDIKKELDILFAFARNKNNVKTKNTILQIINEVENE